MFSEEAISDFAHRYTEVFFSVELIGVSHNTVYKINCAIPFILRITSDRHRNKTELIGELDFITHLHNLGAHVASPIPSLVNELVTEVYCDNGRMFLSAFTIAEGLQWHERVDIDYFRHIGQELGRIHKCSHSYKAAEGICRRQYYDSQHLVSAFGVFKDHNPELHKTYELFLERISRLPKSTDNYGLIHGDFLLSNYNITLSNKVTVYDFDECEYSWYISDIATALYYYLTGGDPAHVAERGVDARTALTEFMSGYLKENKLPFDELRRLDIFFRLRDYVLLSTILGRNDESLSWWDALLLPAAMDRVLNDKPFVDIDIDFIIDTLTAQ